MYWCCCLPQPDIIPLVRAFHHRIVVRRSCSRGLVCVPFFCAFKNNVEGIIIIIIIIGIFPPDGRELYNVFNVDVYSRCSMYVWNENVIMRKIASTAELNSTEPNKIEMKKIKWERKKKNISQTQHTAQENENIFDVSLCVFFLLYFSNLVLILLFFRSIRFVFFRSPSLSSLRIYPWTRGRKVYYTSTTKAKTSMVYGKIAKEIEVEIKSNNDLEEKRRRHGKRDIFLCG